MFVAAGRRWWTHGLVCPCDHRNRLSKTVGDDLEEMRGSVEVFQRVRAEVAKLGSGGQFTLNDLSRCARNEDLLAAGGLADSCGSVDSKAGQTFVVDSRLAGVDAHSYSQPDPVRPGM